jgi:hypothetical protein
MCTQKKVKENHKNTVFTVNVPPVLVSLLMLMRSYALI